MHYKNGREVKIGDRVVVPGYWGKWIGIVVQAQAGSNSCNLSILPLPNNALICATAAECLHFEDGLTPEARQEARPAGSRTPGG